VCVCVCDDDDDDDDDEYKHTYIHTNIHTHIYTCLVVSCGVISTHVNNAERVDKRSGIEQLS
jgi:hypothetical protein